jgi:GGDEF domain-containing protein
MAGHPFRQGVRLTACLGVSQAQAQDSPELFVGRLKSALVLAKERGPGSVASAEA